MYRTDNRRARTHSRHKTRGAAMGKINRAVKNQKREMALRWNRDDQRGILKTSLFNTCSHGVSEGRTTV